MFEAIVTLVIPAQNRPHKDGCACAGVYSEVEPAHTEVYRLEFDTEEAMRAWLAEEEVGECSREQLTGAREEDEINSKATPPSDAEDELFNGFRNPEIHGNVE